MRKGKFTVLIYLPEQDAFIKTQANNKYIQAMYKYYLSFKHQDKYVNYKKMMSHERKNKKGSGGVRLTPFCGQVTDYECTKNPLHDFRRVFIYC